MLYYVNGVCGSGKTVTAIDKIAERVKKGETIIYATSTKVLLEQTEKGFEKYNVDVELITSDLSTESGVHQDTVAVRLLDSIRTNDNPKVILCVTKSLIKVAGDLPKDKKLALFIDEGFKVVDTGAYISRTSSEIQGVLFSLGLTEVKPDGYSNNRCYQLPANLKDLKEYTENSLYEIFYQYGEVKLEWVASLKVGAFLEFFSEVTMLAACFDDTIESYVAKFSGVELEALDWGLETEHYSNGYVFVYWILNDLEWRTTFVNKLDKEKLDAILQEYKGVASGQFISLKEIGQDYNLDFEIEDEDGHVIEKPKKSYMPVVSHGLNDYTDYNNFINVYTQMPLPYLNEFLKEHFKMTQGQIRKSYYHYLSYQAALRISLRKSSKRTPINVDTSFCFGDKATAMYFVSKLSDSVKVECRQLEAGKELDVRGPRSDKVSANKQEQKNRSYDRKKLRDLYPDNEDLINEKLLLLRDWRRTHKGQKLSTKHFKEIAGIN
ncbi:DEAD/DEAH box helicase family protein [Shewanella sp.]|uniref:DEAD/DEAH box helicase family protein n=1 Tax=Shewanella sp. TaxID=50422 RepID=UPI003D10B1FA